MLAGVGKLLSNFKSYYNEINSATLTGAIDVVVVEQPDGTFQSSPFHVRFGKLGVMRSREKVVYIEINGEPIDLQMKLGHGGEAFFVEEIPANQAECPNHLATSPIPPSPLDGAKMRSCNSEPTLDQLVADCGSAHRVARESESSSSSNSSKKDVTGFVPINQADDEIIESGGMFDIEVSDDESRLPIPSLSKTVSLPAIEESSLRRTENWALNPYNRSQYHPFSDTDLTPVVSPAGSRPHTPKSDTEFEFADRKASAVDCDETDRLNQWNWGELPESQPDDPRKIKRQPSHADEESSGLWSFMRNTKTLRHKPQAGGIYLDDLNLQEMDPEVAALYFPKKVDEIEKALHPGLKDEDTESGRGPSLPQSPSTVKSQETESKRILTPTSEADTMRDHEEGIYGNIAMSLCGGLDDNQGITAAERFDECLVTFDTFVEKPTLLQDPNLVVRINGKYYNWTTASPMLMSMICFQQTLPEGVQNSLVKQLMPPTKKSKGRSSWWPLFGSRVKDMDVESGMPGEIVSSENSTPQGSPEKKTRPATERHSESGDEADDEKEKTAEPEVPIMQKKASKSTSERYKKTLRLTSEGLKKLNLHEGMNEIEFSVTTAYQGTTRCMAHIYLWKHTDKIIISDIDGTITKSDVLGHILPMVGKDWSQSGVTDLYTKISSNGYKFAYLSARAIGQAQTTRDFLKSVKQGEHNLPPGPLFLSPSSLINAFHKEVIEKKPEEFKISCMKDIQSLFSHEHALYAGFGNKINDIYAYRAVNIPKSRIFLIDPYGRLKSDHSRTFESTYARLGDQVDHYFPPLEDLGLTVFHEPRQFSAFTYWRESLPDVTPDMLV